jgi:hemin uptake protein HemP
MECVTATSGSEARGVVGDPKETERRTTAAEPRHISAVDLFAGAREVILEHDGQRYRLRITSNGKLILTK